MRTLGPRLDLDQELRDDPHMLGIRRCPGGSPRGAARSASNARTDIEMPDGAEEAAVARRARARRYSRSPGAISSRSAAMPVRRTRRSSVAQRVRVGDRVGGEALEAGGQVALERLARARSASTTLPSASAWALSRISGLMPGQLRHALQAALEDDAQLVAAQHRQVGALVRAGQQVVDHAREVVAVGLLGDRLAEAGREVVEAARAALGDALVAQAGQQVVRGGDALAERLARPRRRGRRRVRGPAAT